MANKYRVVYEDPELGSVVIEADSYGTNSDSHQLFLTKDQKPVATFARGEWAGIYLVPEETKVSV